MAASSQVTGMDLYQVLGLPAPDAGHAYSGAEIKAAYRRSLLKHHPDKAKLLGLGSERSQVTRQATATPNYSVDDISKARDILLDPVARKDYDERLRLAEAGRRLGIFSGPLTEGAGYETIDLGDMDFSEETEIYSRACRCGNETAFQISEDDLAREVEQGEVFIGCPGCSLLVKVVFEASPG